MTTIKDIAKRAGVNISTVSRALNDSNEVGEEMKKQIKKIARELDYTPDFAARALAGKSTKLIGMLVPEISSNYYVRIVKSVEAELNSGGYNLILAATEFEIRKEVADIEVFMRRKVDGIIMVQSVNPELDVHLDQMKRKYRIPVVLFEPDNKYAGYDCVLIDREYGIDLAIEHLAGLGHTSVGFLGEELSSRLRLPVFKEAMKRYGLSVEERFVKSGKERFELGGYLRMKELLQAGELPSAIFATYDNIAIGAIKAAHEAGVRVPDHLSVVGYDNIRESEFLITPLTTIVPPIIRMAKTGVEILISRIKGSEDLRTQHVFLKPELVVRGTTASHK